MALDYENPGYIKAQLSLLTILTISSVSSTGLLIYKQVSNTSVENTSYRKEKPKGGKRRVTSESDWKKYYGSSPELKADISTYGKENFPERSYPYILPSEEPTTRKPDNYSFINVLTEKLTDDTPAYYNSNILVLSRYYRGGKIILMKSFFLILLTAVKLCKVWRQVLLMG